MFRFASLRYVTLRYGSYGKFVLFVNQERVRFSFIFGSVRFVSCTGFVFHFVNN